ncbi:MAG TPA: glycoside hydrolase family 2 [Eggerthellaceae bacterium]|nr:glycoside hydrolase family 2 [Eggerthellaceae bacterium]
MLHLKKVLGAKPKEHVVSELATMLTPWGEALDPNDVLAEHPDPQLARATFQVLNGRWACAFASGSHRPTDDLQAVVANAVQPDDEAFDREILVPFSPEAPLSGVGRQLQPDELLWYRRTFDDPRAARGRHAQPARVLLHFQAVDYACAVRVNGQLVGSHAGGYDPFCFDITDALAEGENELAVCVADPSEFGGRLRGKQRFDRGDIWYSAQSGIWQTVWMETVPAAHIAELRIEPDAQAGILAVGVRVSLPAADGRHPAPVPSHAKLEVLDAQGAVVAVADEEVAMPALPALPVLPATAAASAASAAAQTLSVALAVQIPSLHLWSPEDPYLYDLRLVFGEDEVRSYCGFRTVEMRRDEKGVSRVYLNGAPLFIRGVLDQAYWSDGLMTAPADEAFVFDIQAMRDAGFNLMRKHIKVESARWYYHCDQLGMLVLQDMVSGGDAEIRTWHWSYKPTLFKISWNHYRDDVPSHQENLGSSDPDYRREWTEACRRTVRQLGGHPCIIGWSLFNEGWGQFDARKACAMVRDLDSTRVVDAVSGWYDQRCGDFSSVHNYFRDMAVWRDRRCGRAFFISEFGGFTHRVEGHSSLPEAYGYEPFDDIREWRRAVRDALAEVEALEPKGLAGYVYTQVSDIEEETNGILTYDRRINKLVE